MWLKKFTTEICYIQQVVQKCIITLPSNSLSIDWKLCVAKKSNQKYKKPKTFGLWNMESFRLVKGSYKILQSYKSVYKINNNIKVCPKD